MTIFAPVGNEGIEAAMRQPSFAQQLNQSTKAASGLTGLLSNALMLKDRYAVNPDLVSAQKAQYQGLAQTAVPMAHAKLNITESQPSLLAAQAYHMMHPSNPLSNLDAVMEAYRNAPEGSQQKQVYGQLIQKMSTPRSGLSISSQPGGGFTVSEGNLVPTGNTSGLTQSITGTGSSRSQGGKVYQTPEGTSIVAPTKTTQSKDLQQIAAIERVQPQLENLINTVAQTQGATPYAQNYVQGLMNYLNPEFNYQLPSLYASKNEQIANIAESLIKGMGLNPTDESVKLFMKTVEPRYGESSQGYKNRIMGEIANLTNISKQARSRLINGTIIDKNGKLVLPKFAQWKNNSQSEQNQSVKIPRFSGKDEFQSWYNSQPKSVQSAVRKQLGG